MYEFRQTSGILIPREYEKEEFYLRTKQDLRRFAIDYTGLHKSVLKFYVEGKKYLKVPRFYPIHNHVNCKINSEILPGKDIQINHNIQLRDELQLNMLNVFLNNRCGIIQALPGSGKTVVSINAIAEIKKKTFILVHRGSLVDQWIERIFQYTDLDKNEVSRLSSKTFEEDLKKSIIVSTDQTFTSLLKRNRENFIINLNKAEIGVFIADESHVSAGAPTFSECSIHIPAMRTYGLSATPYRYDGNGDIIEYHLGPINVPEGDASTMDARVTIILISYEIMTSKTRKYVYWSGEFNKARYLNQIVKSENLVRLSNSLINKFVKNERDIIYVSDRINLIEKLYDLIDENFDKSKFIGGAGLDSLKHQVAFATTQKARDGIDVASKDCLIMCNPISNIEQLSGRILRILPGKKEPILIDIVDIDDVNIYRSLKSRLKFYDEKKWDIKFILATNKKLIELPREEALKNVYE
jgi:superfamily II DNA or RNA helicase